jgi:hypothetical protein
VCVRDKESNKLKKEIVCVFDRKVCVFAKEREKERERFKYPSSPQNIAIRLLSPSEVRQTWRYFIGELKPPVFFSKNPFNSVNLFQLRFSIHLLEIN